MVDRVREAPLAMAANIATPRSSEATTCDATTVMSTPASVARR
jgi:hypothetical protein